MAMAQMRPDEVEMFESAIDDEEDEVQVVEMQMERNSIKHTMWINEPEDFTWEKKEGHVPSPEKVGMDELEEWLEGI